MPSIEELKKYIDFLSTTDIEELEIETSDGEKISLKRSSSNLVTPRVEEYISEKKGEDESINVVTESKTEQEYVITSPMVGKFLLSPSKDHPPFIVENAEVKQGQKVAIIETMRIFRDVISPKDGIVKKILVEDGVYVEYGQPLIVLQIKK